MKHLLTESMTVFSKPVNSTHGNYKVYMTVTNST